MIGPDHYREAERTMSLARCATADQANGTEPNEAITMMLAAAQVHATLALAAATALTGAMAAESYVDEPELKAWHDAAGVKPEPDGVPDQDGPEVSAEPISPMSAADQARADLAAESLATLRSKLRGEAATS